MTLTDLASAALAIAIVLVACGLMDAWCRPRPERDVPPVPPRAMRNLLSRIESEREQQPGRQT